MRETDVDVPVVVEATQPGEHSGTPVVEWRAGYFELFGSLRDVNLERPPQGEQQERPPLESVAGAALFLLDSNTCIRFLNGRSRQWNRSWPG